MTRTKFIRRDFFQLLGITGTGMAIPTLFSSFKEDGQPVSQSKSFRTLLEKISDTSLIDTHEHLWDEVTRTAGGKYIDGKCNDWLWRFLNWLKKAIFQLQMLSGTPMY